jgi:hypothetical protein
MITHHRDQGKVQGGLHGCDLLKAVDDAELHEGGWGRRGSRNSKGEGSSGAAGEGLWPGGVGHMMAAQNQHLLNRTSLAVYSLVTGRAPSFAPCSNLRDH